MEVQNTLLGPHAVLDISMRATFRVKSIIGRVGCIHVSYKPLDSLRNALDRVTAACLRDICGLARTL
jgi:hypothetical protein